MYELPEYCRNWPGVNFPNAGWVYLSGGEISQTQVYGANRQQLYSYRTLNGVPLLKSILKEGRKVFCKEFPQYGLRLFVILGMNERVCFMLHSATAYSSAALAVRDTLRKKYLSGLNEWRIDVMDGVVKLHRYKDWIEESRGFKGFFQSDPPPLPEAPQRPLLPSKAEAILMDACDLNEWLEIDKASEFDFSILEEMAVMLGEQMVVDKANSLAFEAMIGGSLAFIGFSVLTPEAAEKMFPEPEKQIGKEAV